MEYIIFYLLVYFLGSSIGSFLGVCIDRIPVKRSIVHPPSACDSCGARLKWYDMVPVFSALLLRGRCRNCGAVFSLRLALVEFLVGLLYVAIVYTLGVSLEALLALFLSSVFVVCFFTDLDRRIIPNKVVLTGFSGGFTLLLSMYLTENMEINTLFMRLLYAIVPSLILMLFSMSIGGIGAGDAKLVSLFGLYFGVYSPVAIGTGFLFGAVFATSALLLKKIDRKTGVPMAPFFAISFIFSIFFRLF